MNKEKYIAALDISSSKITGVVGILHPGGHVDIIAAEQERHLESVRYGHIQNLEDTSRRVARVIESLERNPAVAPRKITGVFVGLNGMSLRSLTTKVSLQLPDETEIDQDILDRLRRQALDTALDNTLEVIDAVDRNYTVGTIETTNPKGATGNRISAVYDLVIARPGLRRNIQRTLADKLHLDVRYMVTALACGLVVLPKEEKRLGCMLVDMGAETTTITIYRRGFLNYLATIPLGARNITRDLTQLNLLEERAEEIKITSGSAIPSSSQSNLNLSGVRLSDVAQIVVARAEEIVANIVEHITYAGITEKDLPAGIICIGGGAKLSGMTELLNKQTGLPVRQGRLPVYVRIDSPQIPAYELIQAVSVLYAGADLSDVVCLEEPKAPELPQNGEAETEVQNDRERKRPEKDRKKSGGWGARIRRGLTNIFVPGGDDDDNDLF